MATGGGVPGCPGAVVVPTAGAAGLLGLMGVPGVTVVAGLVWAKAGWLRAVPSRARPSKW